MARPVLTVVKTLCVAWIVAAAGCERGDASRESCDPMVPSSCAEGWTCRGGVCLRFSTPVEMPTDPTPPSAPRLDAATLTDASPATDDATADAPSTDAGSAGGGG